MSIRLEPVGKVLSSVSLVAFAVVLMASSMVAVFSSSTVSAAPTTVQEKINSYYYYSAVASCLDGLESINDPAQVVTGPVPTRANDFRTVGYIASPTTGSMKCSEIITHAINVWGYSSREQAFGDWGYKLVDGKYTHSGNVGDSIKAAVRKKVYGNKNPSLAPDQQYVNAEASLKAACGVNFSAGKPAAGLTAGEKATYDNQAKYLKISTPTGTPPTPTPMYYAYTPKKDMQIDPEQVVGNNSDQCKAWADNMTRNVNNYMSSSAYTESPPGSSGVDTPESGEAKSTCAIEGVGWIVCPVFNFLGSVTDAAYNIVSDMMTVNTNDYSTNGTLFKAWQYMSAIANVIFVAIFLFIIYSQVTSMGISNYGIKRMLPRLIIGAILINSSYWLCIVAVEVSNVLGYSLKAVFDGIGATVATADTAGDTTGILDGGNTIMNWTGIVASVLILTGAALYAGLAVLLPLILAAVVTIILVFVALTIRQALIIVLIVAAPLALAAWLLPNTESYFKKWMKLFGALLMMFPVVALVFAISSLASVVIMGSSSSTPIKIMGAAVSIVPLVIVPAMMKGASTVLGAFMNRVPGNNFGKGLTGRASKAASDRMQRTGKHLDTAGLGDSRGSKLLGFAIGSRRRARRRAIDSAADRNLRVAETGYISDETKHENSSLLRAMSRGGGEAAQIANRASAVNARQQLDNERIKDRIALTLDDDVSKTIAEAVKMLADANKSGDAISARAATQILLTQTGSAGIEQFHKEISKIEKTGALHQGIDKSVRADANAAGLKGKDRSVDNWSRRQNGESLESFDRDPNALKGMNEREVAGQSEQQLKEFAASGALTNEMANRILSANAQGTIELTSEKIIEIQKAVRSTPPSSGPTISGGGQTFTQDSRSGLFIPRNRQ